VADARGRLLVRRSTSFRGSYVVDVPLVRGRTPYVRVGDLLPYACATLTVIFVGAGLRRDRLVRRGEPSHAVLPITN